MMKIIYGNMSLDVLEKRIHDAISGLEFWGDLNISQEEYEILRERMSERMELGLSVSEMQLKYPLCLTTVAVFMVRYKFNVNFWSLLCSELGITLGELDRAPLGRCILNTFNANGFDISEIESPRIYLDPIIYEACLPPDSCVDDLFYVLKNDAHAVFDPTAIIDDLLDRRTYIIRKSTMRFLDKFHDNRAVDYLLDLHEAIESSDAESSGGSRYHEQYLEWRTKEKSRESTSSRKKSEQQLLPYLMFETDGRGLCIALPRIVLKEEWVEEVVWQVTGSDEKSEMLHCQVYGDEGQRYVKPMTLAIHSAESYKIDLVEDDQRDNKSLFNWELGGIGKNNALFFNAVGRMIHSSLLPVPFGVMIAPSTLQWKPSANLSTQLQSYPNASADYKIVELRVTGSNASLSYRTDGKEVFLTARPNIELAANGERLFSVKEEKNEIPCFTEFPSINIAAETNNELKGIELRMEDTILEITTPEEETFLQISLDDLFVGQPKYGRYVVKVYRRNCFLKHYEFYFVPKIESDYDPKLTGDDTGKPKDRIIHFTNTETCIVEFPGMIADLVGNEVCLKVPGLTACVSGRLSYNDGGTSFTKSFTIPTRPWEITFMDEEMGESIDYANRKKVEGLKAFSSHHSWVFIKTFGEYKRCQFSMELQSDNGVEQKEDISLSVNGCGKIDLAVFQDSMRNAPLPAIIQICCENGSTRTLPITAVAETAEFAKRPRYFPNQNMLAFLPSDAVGDLTLNRFGYKCVSQALLYSKSRLSTNGSRRGYQCDPPLTEGIYTVSGKMSVMTSVFEDDAYQLSADINTFAVSPQPQPESIETANAWIAMLIRDILPDRPEKNSVEEFRDSASYKTRERLKLLPPCELLDVDIERLVAICSFACSEKNHAKKNAIEECTSNISAYILNGTARYRIIQLLVAMNCPEPVFAYCLTHYALHLTACDAEKKEIENIAHTVEPYSKELAALFLLRGNFTVREAIARYHALVGDEAIQYMLEPTNDGNEPERMEERRRFLREQPCKVSIRFTKEISGDMEPISAMIETRGYTVTLNMDKKPDDGIYFDQIRYVDQYINWHKQNSTTEGGINEPARSLIISTVAETKSDLLKGLRIMQLEPHFGLIVTEYHDALKSRKTEGCMDVPLTTISLARYFYLQGIAALLCLMPAHTLSQETHRAAEQFMSRAVSIAPRMTRRDMMMAATYLFLKKKENELCR